MCSKNKCEITKGNTYQSLGGVHIGGGIEGGGSVGRRDDRRVELAGGRGDVVGVVSPGNLNNTAQTAYKTGICLTGNLSYGRICLLYRGRLKGLDQVW